MTCSWEVSSLRSLLCFCTTLGGSPTQGEQERDNATAPLDPPLRHPSGPEQAPDRRLPRSVRSPASVCRSPIPRPPTLPPADRCPRPRGPLRQSLGAASCCGSLAAACKGSGGSEPALGPPRARSSGPPPAPRPVEDHRPRSRALRLCAVGSPGKGAHRRRSLYRAPAFWVREPQGSRAGGARAARLRSVLGAYL